MMLVLGIVGQEDMKHICGTRIAGMNRRTRKDAKVFAHFHSSKPSNFFPFLELVKLVIFHATDVFSLFLMAGSFVFAESGCKCSLSWYVSRSLFLLSFTHICLRNTELGILKEILIFTYPRKVATIFYICFACQMVLISFSIYASCDLCRRL